MGRYERPPGPKPTPLNALMQGFVISIRTG